MTDLPIDPEVQARLDRNPEVKAALDTALADIDSAKRVEMTTPPAPIPGITFLRSTTTTRVDRQADGDSSTTVEHTANFAVKPGVIPDQHHQYSQGQVFRPLFLAARWVRGQLAEVKVTGRRILKNGSLQKPSEQFPDMDISREAHWAAFGGRELDRTQLPEPIPAALAAYEWAVTMTTEHGIGAVS